MNRIVDQGAIFAGWVGLGVAVVVVMAFALIIPVQALVFVLAPPVGLLIGWYANERSARSRPRGRVLGNASWAGLVTGVGLAGFYIAIRLLFVYGDSGALPDGTQLSCQMGPECTYQRHVAAGRGAELAEQGITDGRSFESAVLREQLAGGAALIVLTFAGSVVAGAVRAQRGTPALRPAG